MSNHDAILMKSINLQVKWSCIDKQADQRISNIHSNLVANNNWFKLRQQNNGIDHYFRFFVASNIASYSPASNFSCLGMLELTGNLNKSFQLDVQDILGWTSECMLRMHLTSLCAYFDHGKWWSVVLGFYCLISCAPQTYMLHHCHTSMYTL